MVDFQYEPESHDPVSMLRNSMNRMDGLHLGLIRLNALNQTFHA